jgi:hypothetical protein
MNTVRQPVSGSAGGDQQDMQLNLLKQQLSPHFILIR